MKIPFAKKEEAPPPEPEPPEPEPRQDRIRVTYPTAQIEASVKEALDDLRRDVAEYSYKTREGDVAAGDRLETVVCFTACGVAGLISDKRPDIAVFLWRNIRRISDKYNGKEFLDRAAFVINRAIGMTMFVGRNVPGTSVDKGEGLDEILRFGEDR